MKSYLVWAGSLIVYALIFFGLYMVLLSRYVHHELVGGIMGIICGAIAIPCAFFTVDAYEYRQMKKRYRYDL